MIKRSRVRAGGSINTSTRESSARASILPRSRSRAFAAAFTAENALVNVNVNVNAERTFTFAPSMAAARGRVSWATHRARAWVWRQELWPPTLPLPGDISITSGDASHLPLSGSVCGDELVIGRTMGRGRWSPEI